MKTSASLLQRLLLAAACLALTTAATAQHDDDPLDGKQIGVIGDSYVRNHREPVENTWHYKLAKKHHMTYYNYGRNGSCVAMDRQRFGPAVYKRYKDMKDSLDYVVVIAGHNDAALLDTVGMDNYREKLDVLCRGLLERYPLAHIYFFTCWANDNPAFLRIVDATKEVCGSHGIPVFDAARQSNIHARSDAFRREFFQGRGVNDHAHLNAKGHDRFLPIAEKFILAH